MSDPNIIQLCIDGAALAPIGSRERQELALLARQAYRKAMEAGFDAWRHQQVKICCERDGLREARHEDYALIKAHFLRIIGNGPAADRQMDRAQLEPRRVALHKLGEECTAAADVISNALDYAKAIGRKRYHGAALDDLSERQIWGLVFDLRRNAQRRRKKGTGS